LQILPAGDVAGAHGKTYGFCGFDEIHAYRNHDLFEALAPDPSRLDALIWITSYAGLRHAPGIPLYDFMRAGKARDDLRMKSAVGRGWPAGYRGAGRLGIGRPSVYCLLGKRGSNGSSNGVGVAAKPEMRRYYPEVSREISRRVRFKRAARIWQGCGRRYGVTVRPLPGGPRFDPTRGTWRNGRERMARWLDLVETAQMRRTRVTLAAARFDHDPSDNRLRNLNSLCQRRHLIHDRQHHLAQRRIIYLLRRSLGDLFLGPYSILLQFANRPLPDHWPPQKYR
jgi:hypothetical protein